MRERMLAVAGAICLVALALVIRGAISGGDDGDAKARPGSNPKDLPVVACTKDLKTICDALVKARVIATSPPTLDLGTDVDPEIDGWITWDPAPRVAGYARPTGDPSSVWPEVAPLATGKLAVLGSNRSLTDGCGSAAVTWKCLAAAVDGGGGRSIGIGDPTTADGLARLSTGPSMLTEDEPSRIGELKDLVMSPPDGQADQATMARSLVTKPGSVDLVVGAELLLRREADSPRGRSQALEVRAIGGAPAVSIVIAHRNGGVDASTICEVLEGGDGAAAIATVGLARPCSGDLVPENQAGFLFQVWKRLG